MKTDIEQVLEKSSRTVPYGSSGQSTMISGLGSFSKASIVASNEDGDGQDVDLDDPDFKKKAVGLEAPHESIGEDGNVVPQERRIIVNPQRGKCSPPRTNKQSKPQQ